MPMPTSGASPAARAAPIVKKPTCSDTILVLPRRSLVPLRPQRQFGGPLDSCAAAWSLSVLRCSALEGGVEGPPGGLEVDPAAEGGRLARPVLAIHPRVLPVHGEGPLVADVVQGPNQGLEVHIPVSGRDEVPVPAEVPEGEVAAVDAGTPVPPHAGVLDVHVIDAVGEIVDEDGRIE